jgi:hypothetical protein
VSEFFDTFISVVHSHTNASFSFVLEDLHFGLFSVCSFEKDCKSTRLIDFEVSGFVLVSKGVPANNDGFFPSRDQSGDVLDDDRLPENGSIQNVSDGSIGTFPHLFEFKLFDSGFVWSDGCALDSDFTFLNGFSSIDCDLIVGLITVFDAKIKVLNGKVQEGKDEFIFDGFPDDPGHLIAIKFDDWIGNFDFRKLHEKVWILNCANYKDLEVEFLLITSNI